MSLIWKDVDGKQVGTIFGATNPAFILDGQVLEVRITGAEHLSGEKAGSEEDIKNYCSTLLEENSIPLEGTNTVFMRENEAENKRIKEEVAEEEAEEEASSK